ncbi:hypothetical protein THASP1DRAFT_27468 [Thamnocephalis sphaerospora]|uniref:Mis12-Mtw1 protein family-domain-containing protein n=1 Tax=Thamnocephalis sphaerospora TaxID=78915 RepID=A0A4P9XZ70_9FUNG|nr:hypothetical protein THASP1DRAFT_27468 [Thamnocephalis sphaerospora]|eukprot:RKP10760.1 hypothetical protein THASP1DRAFT_27468 [Thamnocephalis sphaerospora]
MPRTTPDKRSAAAMLETAKGDDVLLSDCGFEFRPHRKRAKTNGVSTATVAKQPVRRSPRASARVQTIVNNGVTPRTTRASEKAAHSAKKAHPQKETTSEATKVARQTDTYRDETPAHTITAAAIRKEKASPGKAVVSPATKQTPTRAPKTPASAPTAFTSAAKRVQVSVVIPSPQQKRVARESLSNCHLLDTPPQLSRSVFSQIGIDTVVPVKLDNLPESESKRYIQESARRRSSTVSRGQRASSLLGDIPDLPPDNISPELFYRHIAAKLPGPQKMVANAVIGRLKEHKVNTSFYTRDASYDEVPTGKQKLQEHPQNVINTKAKAEIERDIVRLHAEVDEWTARIDEYNGEHALITNRRQKLADATAEPFTLDLEKLRPSEADFARRFMRDKLAAIDTPDGDGHNAASGDAARAERDEDEDEHALCDEVDQLATAVAQLNAQINLLGGRTHQLTQEARAATKYGEEIVARVRTREQTAESATPDPMDLLRALSIVRR